MSYRGEQKIKNKIYVYEAIATWNSEKHRSEQKRIYIGTKDPVTRKFYPNKKYFELYGDEGAPGDADTIPKKSIQVMCSRDYGNIYLMEYAAKQTGLTEVLQECFPEEWMDILSCAMHCCSENEPLYLCQQWAEASFAPSVLSSQQISKLLASLDEERRMNFYKQWAHLRAEKEYLALDISSVSSWSELIHYVECGYNHDHEKLPQINLAMLFGESSRLPVFSRIYPGSIKDVSTLAGIVSFTEGLDLKQMHFVMDKGFYSEKGIGLLLEKYIKFAVGVPFTTKVAKQMVENSMEHICDPRNAIEVDGHIYYASTLRSKMKDRRVYYYVYFDRERQLNESNALMSKVLKLEKSLISGTVNITDREAKKYFSFHKNKEGTYNIHRKEEVIQAEIQYAGYFVLLTNDSKNAEYTLEMYRTKDVVEKSFNNIKNELDLHCLRIHSDTAMEGRIFIGFISLVIMSFIRERMRGKNMYKTYSFHTLFAELKKLKIIEFKNGRKILTELTASHKAIFKTMGISAPDSSSI